MDLSGATPSGPNDPVAAVVLALAVVLAAAKLGGDLAERIGQSAVLGELLAGVLLGNLSLTGLGWFEPIAANETVGILAQIGAILLLFEAGLDSTVRDMLQVGLRSLLVAVLGVVTPWALGWWVGTVWLPQHSAYTHAFLGATLTATSVGITARVLQDLGRSRTREARIILGAAVIDDVLGLVILAAVTSAIRAADLGAALPYGELGWVLVKALAFLVGALMLGVLVTPPLFRLASRLRGRGVLLTAGLLCCFLLAYAAAAIGLAPIVGAYAAGLILEDAHHHPFIERGERRLDELVQPLSTFLVPLFFVLTGMRVDLGALARPEVLGLAGVLTAAAVAGKQACAFGGLGGGLDGRSIGLGMIPRGEVGLIFASIGLGLTIRGAPVLDAGTFSAVVVMVMATTLLTPPLLKWSLERGQRPPGPSADGRSVPS